MIDKNKIEEIKNKIAEAFSPQKIILFGSYASGQQTASSDVDLVVIWDNPENQFSKNLKIRRLFPKRNFALDIFTFTTQEVKKYKDIKGTILNTAFTKGKTLYEQKSD